MDVEAATGRDRVAGKPRPEKDVRRTLIFRLDIVLRLNWCWERRKLFWCEGKH